jgi:hypothetical protein
LKTLAQTRAHYDSLKDAACLAASRSLRASLGIDVRIRRVGRSAHEQVRDVWDAAGRHPDAGWDWEEIFRKHREPKCLDMAIWTGNSERLIALAMATMNTEAATLRYCEGNPVEGCDYKGKRVLIALEAVANYALGAGLAEIRIDPVNGALASMYEKVYGFELVKPSKAPTYYRKGI